MFTNLHKIERDDIFRKKKAIPSYPNNWIRYVGLFCFAILLLLVFFKKKNLNLEQIDPGQRVEKVNQYATN